MNTCILTVAAASVPLMLGCASYPMPSEHLTSSYASIRAAQEVGATAWPQAALHLKLAQEEQAKAKELASDSKNEEADYMTLRANADAELALAIARESMAEGRAAKAEAHAGQVGQEAAAAAAAPPATTATTTTTTSATTPARAASH
jgi:hypothetical protein